MRCRSFVRAARCRARCRAHESSGVVASTRPPSHDAPIVKRRAGQEQQLVRGRGGWRLGNTGASDAVPLLPRPPPLGRARAQEAASRQLQRQQRQREPSAARPLRAQHMHTRRRRQAAPDASAERRHAGRQRRQWQHRRNQRTRRGAPLRPPLPPPLPPPLLPGQPNPFVQLVRAVADPPPRDAVVPGEPSASGVPAPQHVESWLHEMRTVPSRARLLELAANPLLSGAGVTELRRMLVETASLPSSTKRPSRRPLTRCRCTRISPT
jgi:hypothetical protein